jgi:hypothetical protein
MSFESIRELHDQYVELLQLIDVSTATTSHSVLQETLRKSLLVAVGNFFEKRITGEIEVIAREAAPAHPCMQEFVKNKALTRQYHSLFAWRENNANAFLSLFGVSFKQRVREKISADQAVRDGEMAFMELGRLRNTLVHEDYMIFPSEKSAEEIFGTASLANEFVNVVVSELRECGVAANES